MSARCQPKPRRPFGVLPLSTSVMITLLAACGDQPFTAPAFDDGETAAARAPTVILECDPATVVLPAGSTTTVTCTAEAAVDRRNGVKLALSGRGSVPDLTLRPLGALPGQVHAGTTAEFAFALDATGGAPVGAHSIAISAGNGANAPVITIPVEVASAGPVIRLAYLLPTDIGFEAAVIDSLDRSIRRTQAWYQEHAGRTFAIGLPTVETHQLAHPAAYYTETPNGTDPAFYYFWNTLNEGMPLTGATFYSTSEIWLLVNAASAGTQIGSAAVPGIAISDGLVMNALMGRNPALTACGATGAQAHELGHTFGLPHSDPPSLMSIAFLDFPNATLWPSERATVLASPFVQTVMTGTQALSCAGTNLLASRASLPAALPNGTRRHMHPDTMPELPQLRHWR